MRLSIDEKRLMAGALSIAIGQTRSVTMRARYTWLRKRVDRAIRDDERGSNGGDRVEPGGATHPTDK